MIRPATAARSRLPRRDSGARPLEPPAGPGDVDATAGWGQVSVGWVSTAVGGSGNGVGPGRSSVPVARRGRGLAPTGPLRRGEHPRGHLLEQCDRVRVPAKGWVPLQSLVQRRSQGEDVGSGGGLAASGNLGGDERRSSMNLIGGGERGIVQRARDAEVADQGGAVVGDQDVAGLDVAVGDAGLVGGGQRGRDVGAGLHRFVGMQRPAVPQHTGEGDRRQELHDDARSTVVLHHVEDRHRVGMGQAGRDPGLAHRPLVGQVRFGWTQARRPLQLFQRDRAVQPLVPRPPHGAHASGPDQLQQSIPASDQIISRAHSLCLHGERGSVQTLVEKMVSPMRE
jgi:hypothetical protein